MSDSMRDDLNEQNLAQQTMQALQGEGDARVDDPQTFELGQRLREAALHERPESNSELRELLQTQSYEEVKTVSPPSSSGNSSRLWRLSAIAASLLCCLGLGYFLFRDDVYVAGVMDNEPPAPEIVKPEVVYRMETRTHQVPVTKWGTETKTPTVPVQKMRTETRTRQLANGKMESYKVEVPYTENVTQNYSRTTPYTENVTQSYQVKVPYTADGKEIAKEDYEKYGVDLSQLLGNDKIEKGNVQDQLKANEREKVARAAQQANLYSQGREITESLRRPETAAAKEAIHLWESQGQPSQGQQGQGQGDGTAQGSSGSPQPGPESANGNPAEQSADGANSGEQNGQGQPSQGQGEQQGQEQGQGEGQRLIDNSESLPRVTMLNGQNKVAIGRGNGITRREVVLNRLSERPVQQQGEKKNFQFHIAEGKDELGFFEHIDGEERSSGEQYNHIIENRFTPTSGPSAVSTFSIDVDTASYSNMRRFLNNHRRPPVDSVRIEELVNYFSYDYPQPKGEDPFSVNMEIASCPWNEAHQLLRVGLKGKEIHVQERPATNVVYLIDVSGSMQSADKLPLLKSGFQMLSRQLGENDRVSIVTYAGNAGVVLEPTGGEQTKTINEAIERLTAGGSTHGSAGIELAYELAQKNFIEGGVNKVMLATDGDLNVGVTQDGALVDLIKQKASEGVFLTVLGFGTGNIKDGKLEQLADNGNGYYAYIDNTREAHRVLVEQLSASLVTIAKDVKIQVEFNPAEVKSYRLIGYENRALATKDFDDDRKDAGEIGAGHSVTAIYEIQPAGAQGEALSVPSGMKYQQAVKEEATPVDAGLSDAAKSGELATLALRYKQPDANESKRIEFVVKNEDRSFPSASDDFRFAASVAGFGMWLRNSEYLGDANLEMLLEMATGSVGDDASGYRSEFVDLIRKAISIRR